MNNKPAVIVRSLKGASPVGQAADNRLVIWHRAVGSAKQSHMSFPRKRESTIVDPRHIFGEERQVLPDPPKDGFVLLAKKCFAHWVRALKRLGMTLRVRLLRLRLERCFAMTCLLLLLMSYSTIFAASVFQDSNRFAYGVKRVLAAPFQIPAHVFRGTFGGPLVLGTIGGVFSGTFQTIGDLAGGIFDMGAAAAPYAKYAVLA